MFLDKDNKFKYQFLSRLQQDCLYYLGFGGRNKKHLHYLDEQEHIDNMKALYNSFSDSEKPEWITLDDIVMYEKEML